MRFLNRNEHALGRVVIRSTSGIEFTSPYAQWYVSNLRNLNRGDEDAMTVSIFAFR